MYSDDLKNRIEKTHNKNIKLKRGISEMLFSISEMKKKLIGSKGKRNAPNEEKDKDIFFIKHCLDSFYFDYL